MNVVKVLLVFVIFFAFCGFAHVIVEKYDQKWEIKDQSHIISRLRHSNEVYAYSISILPEEQRNTTWLAAVTTKYKNDDPNQIAKVLKVKLPEKPAEEKKE